MEDLLSGLKHPVPANGGMFRGHAAFCSIGRGDHDLLFVDFRGE
jgi:hypothetical protein